MSGLNLDDVETTTREEIAAFRSEVLEARAGKLMYPLSAYSLLLENRPDMLKLHMRQAREVYEIPGEGRHRILTALTMLHWYTCNRVEEAILHEIRTAQAEGATRDQVNEVLAIAFTHCGPSGYRFVYHAAFDYLAGYRDPETPATFPAGWAPDPAALRSGMDFSTRALTERDREALFGWYERTIGEVPRPIRFLATYNPAFLKAYRAKWEGAVRGALPKQLLPYIALHFNINRGFRDGIREAALLARAWGMTRAQLIHAITFATGYMAGTDGLYIAEDAVADLLDDWD